MIDLMVQIDLSALTSNGHPATVGTKLHLDRFVSTAAGLMPLARGGRLYIVTLTEVPEQVWLVAVLVNPTFDGTRWLGTPSDLPVTDITPLRDQLRFATNTGWGGWCESCQRTHWYGSDPRPLGAGDVALLQQATAIDFDEPAPVVQTSAPGKHRGALLEAIVENPASDEARKIYADQLLSEGDARGEYIMIDIALAGPLSIRNRERLAARRAHLRAGFDGVWWPYSCKSYETQRGFLRAIHGTWQQIEIAAANELFANEPVTTVGISNLDGDGLIALLSSTWLPRIERLIARGLRGDAAFAKLLESPKLANLRALDVCGNGLGARSLSTIGPALPRVENLVLTGNPIGDAGIDHLVTWQQLPHVHTLYLSSCELGASGLERLLAADLSSLTTLALSHNELDDEAIGILVEHAARLPALEHLELKACGLSTSGAEALAAASLPKLRRLDVRRNDVDAYVASDDARLRV